MSLSAADVLWDAIPRQCLKNIFRALIEGHRLAHERCVKEYEGVKADYVNLEPAERKATIQRLVRAVVTRFPDQVKEETSRGTDEYQSCWYHTRLTAGKVVLTFSPARDPGELVKPTHARRQYNKRQPQRTLFEDDPVEGEHDDWQLYGVLLHGRGAENYGTLGFATIRFPTPEFDKYYDEQIDLFREFPEVVAEMRGTGDEVSDDLPDIEFRDEQGNG